jgi:ubiquinone/menaquinone biosynthesis C-methylase UbiE
MPLSPRGQETDKAFYSASVHYFDSNERLQLQSHVAVVSAYLDAIVLDLQAMAKEREQVDVLELGAGTCLTSLMIRQRFPNTKLTCLDVSLSRMRALIDDSAALLGTHPRDIELIESDFSDALPFDDASFDLIVFDSSLHHSGNIWSTLKECRRLLRPKGAIAALREQYLAPLTYRFALSRLLRTPEVQAGVAENAYLKEQYAYYFRACGFAPNFHPVYPSTMWRLLWPLNGIVFSKWSVWARMAG